MTMPANRRTTLALCGVALSLALVGCATGQSGTPAAAFALGTNASGDPCTASPNWTDPSFGDEKTKFSDAYSVNCRGVTSGALARVRTFDSTSDRSTFGASLVCGETIAVELAGFSSASARRCLDPALGFEAIVIDADHRGAAYQISAAPNSVGPGYQAARIIAGLDRPENATSARNPIAAGSVPALPEGARLAVSDDAAGEALASVLGRGTALNFRGLHAAASRFLRTSLADLPDDAPPQIRAELLLEAGLADSNIEYFGSAKRNLDAAAQQISRLGSAEQRILRPKLQIYRGLDALNQRRFAEARSILAFLSTDGLGTARDLSDPGTLVRLNAGSNEAGDVRSAIALPDQEALREAFLRVQGNWARSVAELALDNPQGAAAAITVARSGLSDLSTVLDSANIRQDGLFWLNARLLRQSGRISAFNGDFVPAVAAFDDAITALTRAALARSGTGRDPAIAELLLERASLVARSGASRAETDEAYYKAVQALVDARDESASFSTSLLQPYLDQLADLIEAGDNDAAARYFEVLQIAGESGAARQLSALQDIVAEESGVGGKRREEQDLLRQISQLDLNIEDARELGQPIGELESERARLQSAYFELDAELQGEAALSQVSSKPAALADLQAVLRPGEAYVRFSAMGDRVFGMLVEKDRASPIRPGATLEELLFFTNELRNSIDGRIAQGDLVEFDVEFAALLYQNLFRDVDEVLRSKQELVVDGGKVLAGLPASVLVSDRRAALRFTQQQDRFDYSQVEFLATLMPTSVAMSPLSFIVSRNLPGSQATRDLIGFASPQPITTVPSTGGDIKIGNCLISPAQLAGLSRRFAPIPADEIGYAAEELGITGGPTLIRDAAFSDTAVLDRGRAGGDLADYKVLHFATHGLTEGMFGCAQSPSALLTSFGSEGQSDLLLDFEEIARLKLDANLVVLSACQTASAIGERAARLTGDAQPGSNLEGLVRSFFAAQARAVMATYWQTPNTGESEVFMREFYRSGRTSDIATALNQAQRRMIRDPAMSHPYFWGSFFVVGDTDNRMLDQAAPQVAAR
ncbi:CHAT domain-containing protein [Erythrobacter sp. JK5]|uniref:CHAT domain-containing protein n=1 Tax=Erythrobacter sp. JK5 TaxID=2829500 RepID=UPI001BA9D40D|nr:CHAT domain-containing protein [Erythrobacter sp. JK5]QUL36790.1 CHAT domain-containing protein [Erythrobacter sp. JK5]